MRARPTTLVSFAAVALMSGCRTTLPIPRASLADLDGYLASDPERSVRSLETFDGNTVRFNKNTALILDLRDKRVAGRFNYISVQKGTFSGELSDGHSVVTPVAEIRAIDIRVADTRKTFGIVAGGVVLGGAALLLLLLTSTWQAPSGRALRIRGRSVVAPSSREPQDWLAKAAPQVDLAGLTPETREILAAYWADQARAEHASVPAFARLSLTLMFFGAPARLVQAAHRAAQEEIEHARLTFALANAYAGTTIAPGPLRELASAPAITAASLEELAAESLVDGCFLEGVAADAAHAAASSSRDPAVRGALAVIVPDEHRHTALAWEIVAWCCQEGGPAVRDAVSRLARRLPEVRAPRDVPATLHARLADHGWLAPAERRELERLKRAEVAARAAELT